MANETSNQTAANETAEPEGNLTAIIDTVEESGLLDAMMDEPLLMALAALVLGMAGYIAYTVPAVKAMVFKYLKNNEAELMELLDKNLTKAQMKAYEKLDEQAQLHVKDSLVKNVLLTAWDEKDDELAGLVKSKVKAALDEQKYWTSKDTKSDYVRESEKLNMNVIKSLSVFWLAISLLKTYCGKKFLYLFGMLTLEQSYCDKEIQSFVTYIQNSER